LLIYAKAGWETWTQDEKRCAQELTEGIQQTYRRH
jgi:putative transcriptional regulator